MSYNGWSNYETWAVALWLDNEEPTYRDMQRLVAREYDPEDQNEPGDEVAYRIGQQIKDYVEAMPDRPTSGLFADLAGAALSEVDWDEVASHYTESL